MSTTAQQPQLSDPAEVVDVSHQKPVDAIRQETNRVVCGSDKERELDTLSSPVKPIQQFHMSGNTAIGDPETPESESTRKGNHNDCGAAPASTLQDNDHEGEISGGDDNHGSPPHNSDTELDCPFNGLEIELGGDAVKAKDEKRNDEGRETLHTRIQGLENYIKIESSKRLEAESRAQILEFDMEVLADRWSSETAAREAAEANANRYMSLFTEARAAWQNTQGIVENKERELAAAEQKINREAGDPRSMQSRLEEVRKGKELDRQHSLALKQALEEAATGGSAFSLHCSAVSVATVPSPEAEYTSIPENTYACGGSGSAKNPSARRNKTGVGCEAGRFESLLSPQANLEDERVAAAEARLERAIAFAATAATSKMVITGKSLVQQKAQLKHVQQQAPMQQGNYAWLSSPRHQRTTTSKNKPLSAIALSYSPPTMTSAVLQQHTGQQHAQRQNDENQVRPCRELEKLALATQTVDVPSCLFLIRLPATLPPLPSPSLRRPSRIAPALSRRWNSLKSVRVMEGAVAVVILVVLPTMSDRAQR